MAGFLLPFITLPYLARVLGPSDFGLLVFSQAFALWLGVLLEFGFNFSATREVARSKGNSQALRDLAAGVFLAKLFLSITALAIVGISWLAISNFHTQPAYLFGAYLIAFGQGWNPSWYFQGVERLRFPALLDIGARLMGTAVVFLIVKSPSDGALVLWVQGIFALVASMFLLWLMYREVPFDWGKPSLFWNTLKTGWGMFVYRSLVSLYSGMNTFFLGLFVSPTQVGYYGGAERIQGLAAAPFWPVWRAIYPRISYLVNHDVEQAKLWLRRMALGFWLQGCAFMLIQWLYAPQLVRLLLGQEYEASIAALRVLSLTLPLMALSGVIGLQWLVPLGLERWLNAITLSAGLTNILLAIVLIHRYGFIGMAYSVVIAETLVVVMMIVVLQCSRNGFWQSKISQVSDFTH